MGIKITGAGFAVGSTKIENERIAFNCGVTAESILDKTGISSRFYLADHESLLDIASIATNRAIDSSDKTSWSLVICATYAHDVIFPSLSSRVANRLKLSVEEMVDLQSNCTGFINSLLAASDKLSNDKDADCAIVMAAEANSPFIDPQDLDAAMFWSDGAGVVTLERTTDSSSGVISRAHLGNLENNEAVRLGWKQEMVGPRSIRFADDIEMGGLATWRQATSGLPKVVKLAAQRAELTFDQIDWFIFHQANLRMIEYLTQKMRIDESKVLINVQHIGNTGAASIPIVLAENFNQNKFKDGDNILMAAVGAGFSFSSLVWRW